jgi:membrane associated rhomboid family serine protease
MRMWNARNPAIVTRVLLAINVGVFLLTLADGATLSGVGDLHRRFAVIASGVAAGEWYRLVTSGFVHYGPLHLAFNMVLLYRLGEALEGDLGHVRFTSLYFASLLAGSYGAVLVSPNALTAGASGAVFGLVAAVAIGQRSRGVDVWRHGVGGLLALNLLFTFLDRNISIGGHLGGLAAGAIVGAAMFHSGTGRRAVAVGVTVAVVVGALAVALAEAAAG